MTLCAQGVPMTEVYLFDWGDTLMVDFPGMAGKCATGQLLKLWKEQERLWQFCLRKQEFMLQRAPPTQPSQKLKGPSNEWA